eukprot:scaffold17027_cov106-Amphora_coffeaeformis.AAC.2
MLLTSPQRFCMLSPRATYGGSPSVGPFWDRLKETERPIPNRRPIPSRQVTVGFRLSVSVAVDRSQSERVGDGRSDVAGRFAVRKGRLRIRVQHAVGGREDTKWVSVSCF